MSLDLDVYKESQYCLTPLTLMREDEGLEESGLTEDEQRPVGSVLREWMEKISITPSTLARQAGLSRATVYVVLGNRSVNPETLTKLANGLAQDRTQEQ